MVTKLSAMMRVLATAFLLHSLSQAQLLGNPIRTDVGVGSRSRALGNNYVALSNDASALFWNPAGLAFNKAREIQFSFGENRERVHSNFRHSNTDHMTTEENRRFKIDNLNFSRSLVTSQGGMSIGLGYQTPYIFDALLDYGGFYREGADSVVMENKFRAIGQLNLWSGGFGIQVARGIGVGLGLSLVTGHENNELHFKKQTNGIIRDPENDHYFDKVTREYSGYDLRLGLMAKTQSGNPVFGFRMVFPSRITFIEKGSEELPASNLKACNYETTGRLRSHFSGALGGSYALPFMTLSAEAKARAPHANTELFGEKHHWKMGAGIGIEFPVVFPSIVARGGYSFHEYSPTPYLVDYEADVVHEESMLTVPLSGEHMVSGGCAILMKNKVSLDFSYSCRFTDLATGNELFESRRVQTVSASMNLHY